jgi:hypothetical protein
VVVQRHAVLLLCGHQVVKHRPQRSVLDGAVPAETQITNTKKGSASRLAEVLRQTPRRRCSRAHRTGTSKRMLGPGYPPAHAPLVLRSQRGDLCAQAAHGCHAQDLQPGGLHLHFESANCILLLMKALLHRVTMRIPPRPTAQNPR